MPTFQFEYDICSLSELNKEEQKLIDAAREAVKTAYAPYSQFQVGCALLLDNEQIIMGSNMENAAYSTTICAERTAISIKHNLYPQSAILSIAIAHTNLKNPTKNQLLSPCGECRQAIAEQSAHQNNPIKVFLYNNDDEIYVIKDSDILLPFGFGVHNLK